MGKKKRGVGNRTRGRVGKRKEEGGQAFTTMVERGDKRFVLDVSVQFHLAQMSQHLVTHFALHYVYYFYS